MADDGNQMTEEERAKRAYDALPLHPDNAKFAAAFWIFLIVVGGLTSIVLTPIIGAIIAGVSISAVDWVFTKVAKSSGYRIKFI